MDSKASPRRVLSKERERDALALRKAGLTYDAIAAQIGTDRAGAWRAVDRGMRHLAAEARTDADELRALELARLDDLAVAVTGKAMGGDLGAVDRALRIIELRSRLLGLEKRPPGTGAVVLAMSAEWIQLQTVILAALEPYPEARAALADHLEIPADAGAGKR